MHRLLRGHGYQPLSDEQGAQRIHRRRIEPAPVRDRPHVVGAKAGIPLALMAQQFPRIAESPVVLEITVRFTRQ